MVREVIPNFLLSHLSSQKMRMMPRISCKRPYSRHWTMQRLTWVGQALKAGSTGLCEITLSINYRRQVKRQAVFASDVQLQYPSLAVGAFYNLSENRFSSNDIRHALNSLPLILSLPFIAHFEGYKYDEIALSLSVPIGTVKRRIHSARQRLKLLLHVLL